MATNSSPLRRRSFRFICIVVLLILVNILIATIQLSRCDHATKTRNDGNLNGSPHQLISDSSFLDLQRSMHSQKELKVAHSIGLRRTDDLLFESRSSAWEPNPIVDTDAFRQIFSNELWSLRRQNFCPPYTGTVSSTTQDNNTPSSVQKNDDPSGTSLPLQHTECKLLWFVGMSEGVHSQCNENNGGYKTCYAVALQSASMYAYDSLQPVLMLGQYGIHRNDPTELSQFGKWAQEQGAIVMNVRELSFQREMDLHVPVTSIDHQMGPYMRLDVPNIIRQYGLFNYSGICPDYALYTDSDVIFANPLPAEEIRVLLNRITPKTANDTVTPFVMYGPEHDQHFKPINTGVMLFHIPRWEQEWPKLLEFGMQQKFVFSSTFDQGWINDYFTMPQNEHKRTLLPMTWNWKAYWGATTDVQKKDIRVVHFHGPKPGKGLDEMAIGSLAQIEQWKLEKHIYFELIMSGLFCDGGRLARKLLFLYNALVPLQERYCDTPADQEKKIAVQ